MQEFIPDYKHVADAAKNRRPRRVPLYEHGISLNKMEEITGDGFSYLINGGLNDKIEFFKRFARFYATHGCDAVVFESCVTGILPGAGALGNHKKGVIQTREDFIKYPWDELPALYEDRFYETFAALGEALPPGMKAVGGVGNGVFECVQDLVGYEDLCCMLNDDPGLFADLFEKMGETLYVIWTAFLARFADSFCVPRFGDDLGFRTQTLLSPDTIVKHVVPQYKKIIDLVHAYGKPFLLHSCGCIFAVMDDFISAGADAKHSNEDQIAPFPVWMDLYGDKMAFFGGLDTDMVCRADERTIREYTLEVLNKCSNRNGFAFGTGNAIADYVPAGNWLVMVETAREFRGDYK